MYKRLATILLFMTALAGACRASAPTPTPVATQSPLAAGPHPTSDTVVASGEVVPVQKVQLSFTMPG